MKRPDVMGKLTRTPASDYLTAATAPTVEAVEAVHAIPVDALRPSPFQPPGRVTARAVQAVREAIAYAGSLAALVGSADDDEANERGRLAMGRLERQDARPLAELAADMAARAADGRPPIDVPLEARQTPAGLELLAGHRRLAAARLAELATVPVRDRGPLDDASAAEVVFRNNRLRADFTPWQEARALAVLRDTRRRLHPGDPRMGSTRDLARLMGYSVGRASELLQMADAFDAPTLEDLGEDRLAGLSYAALRKLIGTKDASDRLALARELVAPPAKPTTGAKPPRLNPPEHPARVMPGIYRSSETRGGGYSLDVICRPEAMPREGLRHLIAFHEQKARALRAAYLTASTDSPSTASEDAD